MNRSLTDRLAWLTDLERLEGGVFVAPPSGRSVRMFGGDWSWLRRLVLRNAGSVHVVEPQSLADDVRESARLALGAYDEQ